MSSCTTKKVEDKKVKDKERKGVFYRVGFEVRADADNFKQQYPYTPDSRYGLCLKIRDDCRLRRGHETIYGQCKTCGYSSEPMWCVSGVAPIGLSLHGGKNVPRYKYGWSGRGYVLHKK